MQPFFNQLDNMSLLLTLNMIEYGPKTQSPADWFFTPHSLKNIENDSKYKYRDHWCKEDNLVQIL